MLHDKFFPALNSTVFNCARPRLLSASPLLRPAEIAESGEYLFMVAGRSVRSGRGRSGWQVGGGGGDTSLPVVSGFSGGGGTWGWGGSVEP